jgi:hypothetical protein
MKYEGPLYGKIGRRYIPLRQTSEEVDAMEGRISEAMWDLRIARQEACDARERTMRLLSTCLEYQPWENSPSLTAKVKADARALMMNPEVFSKIIAKELVGMMKAQAKQF